MRKWLGVVAAIAVLVAGAVCWAFTVDDAYVVARYARNLAQGAGWSMNPGVPSDGLTGPLWILPAWLASAVGDSPVAAAKLVGLCCTAASVGVVVDALRLRADARAAPVAAALLVAGPTLGVWSVGGLETGAACLCASMLVRARLVRTPSWISGAALASIAWLRPELVVFGFVIASTLDRRVLAWGAVGVVTVGLFRLALFGHLLPLPFHAKAAGLAEGIPYVGTALLATTGIAGLVLCAIAAREGRRGARTLAAACVAHVAVVAFVGGDWMPGYRLLAPILPAYAVLASWGVLRTWRSGGGHAALGSMALAMALLVSALDYVAVLPAVRASGDARESAGANLAEALSELDGPVALVDVGFLAFASRAEVVDLGGITDAEVALAPGGHLDKHVPIAYLDARAPAALLLHSSRRPGVVDDELTHLWGYPVEQRVADSSWARTHFRVARVVAYADDYWYVLLVRRELR